jgi:hypothetical protein
MLWVTISECSGRERTWTGGARTDSVLEAIARVVQRKWGPRAAFVPDNGLANLGRYGQIMRWTPELNAYSAITYRVAVRVEKGKP